MSFIRRTDGTVVYGGNHVGSRGSLSSIKYGNSNDDYFQTEEEIEWEGQVLASAITFQDGATDYFGQDYYEPELSIINRLWGIYSRENNPYIKMEFGEGKNTFKRTE